MHVDLCGIRDLLAVDVELDTLKAEAAALAASVRDAKAALAAAEVALETPGARVIATDCSGAALAVAAANRKRWQVESRVHLLAADLVEGLDLESVDLVVSNPPYVAEGDAALKALRREPLNALVAPGNDLSCIHELAVQVPEVLVEGGTLLFEHGSMQADRVHGPHGHAGAGALQDPRHLRIGDVGGRAHEIEEEFDGLAHHHVSFQGRSSLSWVQALRRWRCRRWRCGGAWGVCWSCVLRQSRACQEKKRATWEIGW